MVEIVKDPELIKKFEESESQSIGVNVVTDPDIIKKFENEESKNKGILNSIKKAGISVYDFFDGTKRTEFPEVKEFGASQRVAANTTGVQYASILAGTALTPLMEEKINIIQEQIPDAQIVKDAFDNPMIIMPDGSPLYLNKPGASLEDFATLLSQTLQYLPGASWATQPSKSYFKKILQSGFAGGATSIAQDIAAKPFGAEGIDPAKAIMSTLVPAGFEGAISPAFRFTVKKIFGNPKFTEIVDGQIQLNTKGKKALSAAGIDSKEASSKEWINSFALNLSRGLDEETSAALAAAEEFGLQLAPPQAMGDDMGIAYLFQAANGKHGIEAQKVAKEFLEQQELSVGDITSNVLHKIVTGNQSLKEIEQESPNLYKAIIDRHTKSSENVNTAYNAINKDGVFTGNKSNIDLLNLNILKTIDENDMLINGAIDKELYPVAHKAFEIIKQFGNSTKRKEMIIFDNNPITFSNKTYRDFDKVYKQLQGLYKSNLSPADKKVLTLVKNEYDKFIDDSLTNSLFTRSDGTNATSLEIIKNASKLSKEHFDLFGSRNGKSFVDRTLSKILNDKDMTPEKTLDLIFNLNSINQRNNATEIIKRLKTVFGVSGDDFGDAAFSSDFTSLRKGFINKMIFNATGKSPGSNDVKFIPSKMVTDWEITLAKNPRLISELFNKKEIKQITEFVTQVKKTLKPKDLTSATVAADGIVANIQQTLRGLFGVAGFNVANIQGLLVSRSIFDNVSDAYGKKAALKLVEFRPNQSVLKSPLGKLVVEGPGQTATTVGTNINLGVPSDSGGRIPFVPANMLPGISYEQNQRKNIDPNYIATAKSLGLLD